MSFWRAAPEGVTVLVKVHPCSRRPGLNGRMTSAAGERLKIAVTEAAEEGRANRAARDTLAKVLDMPRSAVQIVNGTTSREKLLTVAGNTDVLAGKLQSL